MTVYFSFFLTEICPDDLRVDSYNITSNDMETGTVVVENPKQTMLDLPLYNPSGTVTFEVFVKPPFTPQAQFYTIELMVSDAASVKIMLKKNGGVTVKTLQVSAKKSRRQNLRLQSFREMFCPSSIKLRIQRLEGIQCRFR